MMSTTPTILVLGGTGRTGSRVVRQLLSRGTHVRVIVRPTSSLPEDLTTDPNLTVVRADLLSMSDEDLAAQVRDCTAVISCLGHTISVRGVLGPPYALVTRAVQRVCRAAETRTSDRPLRFVLMSSVSVNRPGRLDTRRGPIERAVLAVLGVLIPPTHDNQAAADFLAKKIGASNPSIEWVAVRPDTLLEGEVSDYVLHEGLVSSLAKPDSTTMSNVAHFMCELTHDDDAWERWKSGMPVIVNAASAS